MQSRSQPFVTNLASELIISPRILLVVKRFLIFVLFVSAMLSIPTMAKRLTHGFKIAKMRLDFPFHPEWEVSPSPELLSILDQPYHFLGKGAQSYVFESRDGKHVIKLFRYDQPTQESKIVLLFNACKIAYDSLREETGLVYIHLNSTSMGLPILNCTDAVGRKYKFPLDQFRFALQRKAIAFRSALEKAKGSPIEMQKRIDQFIDLLQSRTALSILNTDPNVSRNFGFLENRAIEFDFGNYQLSQNLNRSSEIRRYTSKLRRWLKKEAPEWVAYLDQKVEAID